MLDTYFECKKCSRKERITATTLISAALVALAVALPQIFHVILGAAGGSMWLPMFLPVLVGGCLLGMRRALPFAVLSPIASFLITSAFGTPMPAASGLAQLTVDIVVVAVVCGAFSRLISKSKWFAFPAVWAALLAGRLARIAVSLLGVAPSLENTVLYITNSLPGIALHSLLAPVCVILLHALMTDAQSSDK